MSELSPQLLMQLHDGELDAELEAELLAQLELEAAEAGSQLEGLEQLGDFLRSAAEHQAVPFESVADQVMSALDKPALKLVAAQRAADGDSAEQSAPKSSESIRGSESINEKAKREPERGWVLGVGVLLATAAAGLLWMQRPLTSPPEARPVAAAPVAPRSSQLPAPAPAALPAEDPVAIVSVDFGGNDGTIFVVGEESTPVVWLADDLPVKKTKMGPL